jgi:hypothetical protein
MQPACISLGPEQSYYDKGRLGLFHTVPVQDVRSPMMVMTMYSLVNLLEIHPLNVMYFK